MVKGRSEDVFKSRLYLSAMMLVPIYYLNFLLAWKCRRCIEVKRVWRRDICNTENDGIENTSFVD
jgi:hypothetical protein